MQTELLNNFSYFTYVYKQFVPNNLGKNYYQKQQQKFYGSYLSLTFSFMIFETFSLSKFLFWSAPSSLK